MRTLGVSKLVAAATIVVVLGASAVLSSAAAAKSRAAKVAPSHQVRIQVLSTRADLVSGGEALIRIVLPLAVKPSAVRLDLNGHAVTHRFAVRANGKFEGLLTGLRLGSNTLTARLPSGYGARLHDHQSPHRRPGVLRTADPAVAVPERRQRQAVRPGAGDLVLLRARRRVRRRTANTAGASIGVVPCPTTRASPPPALGDRHHDDHRRGDGAVHRPPGDRLHRPRPVRDRDAVATGEAVATVGAAAPVQRPPGDHPRRELRHHLRHRHRPERAGPEDPRRRLHRDVDTRSTTPATTATCSPRPSR